MSDTITLQGKLTSITKELNPTIYTKQTQVELTLPEGGHIRMRFHGWDADKDFPEGNYLIEITPIGPEK